MSKPCQDSYSINFTSFPLMLAYHEKMRQESRWERTEVNHLTVAPLDKNSPLFGDRSSFAPAVSEDAIRDTADTWGWPSSWATTTIPCAIPHTRACWIGRRSMALLYRS